MATYYELETRANAKSIRTFGDVIDAIGVEPEELWPGTYEDLHKEKLYKCDYAIDGLEILAGDGLI